MYLVRLPNSYNVGTAVLVGSDLNSNHGSYVALHKHLIVSHLKDHPCSKQKLIHCPSNCWLSIAPGNCPLPSNCPNPQMSLSYCYLIATGKILHSPCMTACFLTSSAFFSLKLSLNFKVCKSAFSDWRSSRKLQSGLVMWGCVDDHLKLVAFLSSLSDAFLKNFFILYSD